MQELIKTFLPWALLLFWLLQCRTLRRHGAAAATLYLTIFAGFASNFTHYYRELAQLSSALAAAAALLIIVRRGRIPTFNRIYAVFLSFVLLSLVTNDLTSAAIAALVNIASIVLVVNFLFLMLESSESFLAFIAYYVRLALIVALGAILEWLVLGGRCEGTFSNANYLGFFLGPATCASLCAPHLQSRLKWLFWIALTLGIYVTGSRAAIFFPVLALLASCVSLGPRKFLRLTPILIGIVVGAALAPLPDTLAGRGDSEGSNQERLIATEVGVEMMLQNPLEGVGWGRYADEYWSYLMQSDSLFSSTGELQLSRRPDIVSHNDFVRVAAEMGIPAALFFVALVTFSIYEAANRGGNYKWFMLAVLGGVLIFSSTHNNLNNSILWFFLILPMMHRRYFQPGPSAVIQM